MYDEINRELFSFLKKSPTAFHAVEQMRQALELAGYVQLPEFESWHVHEGGRYYCVRGGSSLIAFRIPRSDFSGFLVGACHSDSPAFKLKVNPEMAEGPYVRLNVEKYGGMLMSPWMDRPLSVAGRLMVRHETMRGMAFESRLVQVDRDLVLIPSLAIHMDRKANEGHTLNAQVDTIPLFGERGADGKTGTGLRRIVAAAAEVDEESIAAADLFLYSRTEPAIWGADREFLSAGHLDDLQSAFALLQGFVESGAKSAASRSYMVPVLAFFDNEEVGSRSRQGADSTFLEDVLFRLNAACGRDREHLYTAVAQSFMVSADNAHAVHPNFPAKADPVNRPRMNGGVVLKHSANQKYTTDAASAAMFKEVCSKAGVPVQEFTNRSDLPGGSTLGNISLSHVSLSAVDVGLAQLAMHSPYETAGARDTAYLARAMEVFYETQTQALARGGFLVM